MELSDQIKIKIEQKTGSGIVSIQSLSGGCISNAYKLEMKSGEFYFLKINYNSNNDMFIKEAHGLIELAKPNVIRIPKVTLCDDSFILTEFISTGNKNKNFFEDFGRSFAWLHKFHNEFFGFYEDNYIGSNVQQNIANETEKNNWIKFYFNKRILSQLRLAEKNGYSTNELVKGIYELENKIEDILKGSEELPSLLHGDLWGGNYIVDEAGNACLIDPAVYYGHREADLAMTKLFGGFSPEFYHAYNEIFPLADGYNYREGIYKLYHVLNHLNLFGRGYYSQAISIIKSYIT